MRFEAPKPPTWGGNASVNTEPFSLRAIVGPPRSGTTWLGALVDSSPEVIYRFEPFHRLSVSNQKVGETLCKLKSQAIREADVRALYFLICPAHPLTNKAPFFDDKSYPLRTFGRRQLWPLARLAPPARSLYRVTYSPQPGPPLVFKEVTFVLPLRNLVKRTSVPVAYLVRHPCATVLSALSAPDGSPLASTHLRLRQTLAKNAPKLLDRYKEVIDGTDVVSQHALMWLYQVESCVSVLRRSKTGLLITYEQLADDAYSHGKTLFGHFGIKFGDATRRFLDQLYGTVSRPKGIPRRTGWGAAYYSVYRNPRELKDLWKSQMATADRKKVESIVRGHPAVELCASLGNWW
jgi:Sulfotransferase domain